MPPMPRRLPKHAYAERNRHGTVVFYFRVGKGKRIRLRGNPDSKEFARDYHAAFTGGSPEATPPASSETLAWLIARYRDSRAWAALAPATRRQRELVLQKIAATAGTAPYTDITRRTVMAGLDRRKSTPFAAKTFLKTLRGLFRWAAENSFVEKDPTEGIQAHLPRTDGFHAWTDEEIARFEARWAIGSRERLALAVLLYTGLRRGDAAHLGRQHIRDDVITFRTTKTGQQVTIPLLPELAKIIDATKTGDLALIATTSGGPMTKESFGNWFRQACWCA
jgi:integrase